MTFEFSIRASLKQAWAIFKKHAWYFLGLALVMVVFSFFSKSHDENVLLSIIIAIASVIWSFVGISSVLAAVDGKEEMLRFDSLKLHLPTMRQFFLFIGLGIASGIMITAGFIMLIIPGIYFLVKLFFANFAFVDRKGGIVQSMKYSWHMVKGDIFWTVLLGFLVAAMLMFIGMLLLGIGVLVTYPLAVLFLGILYRSLTKYQPPAPVVAQPAEIPPATPAQ